ncbi:hypothetical protein Riv7116_0677 [Rivularia sp. PCC 7116]|uniref:hypothetical protein n=1 Tax=Rivularia sp. PCC 7116 TaxID=373994 RepID=UPI00029ED6A1|nr:hypothetical protein [Rivularia sp. PCC 7116]AFY53267.1 hypothetical protein Riv7116_0677 [Rivularia sp. PCC 7116]
MLRLYHVLIGFILIPIGITTAASYFSAKKDTQASSAKIPTPAVTSQKPNQDNIWNNLLENNSLPEGWKINPCENKKSLLCISANEKILGTVEMKILPVKTQPNFQKALLNTGIPIDQNINYQSPKYISQVTTALNSWVQNYYGVIAKKRKYVYNDELKTAKTADGILFSTYPLQKAQVGKLQGVTFGFTGIKQKGGLREQYRGYVAFDGKAIYLISTGFDAASSNGNFEKLENFSIFQPYLNSVVANLKLPN